MTYRSGVFTLGATEFQHAIHEVESLGYRIYEFSTRNQSGREGFFEAVRQRLPLDPPVRGSHSWDALSDSLWEGLRVAEADKIAVAWRAAGAWSLLVPDEFQVAKAVLADVCASLPDSALTSGRPKQVCALIEID